MNRNRLNRITTKFGDTGTTNLVSSNVRKSSLVINLIGDLDEANSSIGTARVVIPSLEKFDELLNPIQNTLFDIGADIICKSEKIGEDYIKTLENEIKNLNKTLPPLDSFVIPKGPSAPVHLARTVVRRAERSFWTYIDSTEESIPLTPGVYLNRLSDLLFIIARCVVHQQNKEETWQRAK